MGYNRNEGDGNEQKFAMDILIGYVTMCRDAKSCNPSECPLGVLASNGNCTEMIQRFPEKAMLIIQDYIGKPWSYFDEYKKRFPFSNLALEDFAYDVCRKKVFEGATECTGKCNGEDADCLACWKQEYLFDKDDSSPLKPEDEEMKDVTSDFDDDLFDD